MPCGYCLQTDESAMTDEDLPAVQLFRHNPMKQFSVCRQHEISYHIHQGKQRTHWQFGYSRRAARFNGKVRGCPLSTHPNVHSTTWRHYSCLQHVQHPVSSIDQYGTHFSLRSKVKIDTHAPAWNFTSLHESHQIPLAWVDTGHTKSRCGVYEVPGWNLYKLTKG